MFFWWQFSLKSHGVLPLPHHGVYGVLENSVQAVPDLHQDFFNAIQKLFEIDIDRKKATWLLIVHAACFMILRGPFMVRW